MEWDESLFSYNSFSLSVLFLFLNANLLKMMILYLHLMLQNLHKASYRLRYNSCSLSLAY